MQKILTIVCFLTLLASGLQAQQKVVEQTLPVPPNRVIDLKLRFGNHITIKAWDKKEASIKVTYEINGGKLNEALLLKFNSDQKSTRLDVNFDQELLKTGKATDCPGNGNRNYNNFHNSQGYVTCSQIDYEIFVPLDANLAVETISADIEILGLTGPVKAKSISGFVDMSWPNKKGAAVSLKTITGEVYSDLNIDFINKPKEAPMVGYQLKGNVNGGGAPISLESISNNIYLRKKE